MINTKNAISTELQYQAICRAGDSALHTKTRPSSCRQKLYVTSYHCGKRIIKDDQPER